MFIPYLTTVTLHFYVFIHSSCFFITKWSLHTYELLQKYKKTSIGFHDATASRHQEAHNNKSLNEILAEENSTAKFNVEILIMGLKSFKLKLFDRFLPQLNFAF